MRKLINLVALAALMFVPFAAQAQPCTPSPSSKDGSGITNVTYGIGTVVNQNVTWGSAPFYGDYSSQIGSVPAGTTAEMSITFATGYDYGTIIWVDWNGDNTFSGTEVVYVGTAPSTNPTTLAVSFDIPSSQATGNYLMRICAADSYFENYVGSISAAANANPCASYTWGVALDFTLQVIDAPSCLRPETLTASDITSDGLTLNWIDTLNSTSNYIIDYWAVGGDTASVTSNTTSYTFSGLDANTLYYFSVIASCSATEQSLPLTGSFKTDCEGGACFVTVNAVDSYGDGWNGNAINVMQGGAVVGSATIASGNSNTVQIPVCSGDPVTLTFTRGSYPDEMQGTVTDGGGATIFTIDGMDSRNDGATLATVDNPCPSCIPPSELTVVPDSNQIEFSWTANSGATEFIVYLNGSAVDDVDDTTYTFSGLDANTPFTVAVQSICDGDDSSSIVSVNTRTTCGQMPIPFFEDFESVPYNGAWPSCWNLILNHNTDPSVNYNDNHTDGGQYSMYMMAYGDYNMFASPAVPLAGNNIYVRFWARMIYGDWLKAGVMTNLNDTSTFIPLVAVPSSSNEWTEYEFNTSSLDPNATYYVAWIGTSNNYWSALGLVDDIYISEIPSCPRVTDVVLDSAEQTSLYLSWGGIDGATYTVNYWANGSNDTSTATAANATVILTDLATNTLYNITVVANCATGDAETSPVFSFRTACGDITLPFTDNFDNYDNGVWPPCWHRLRAYGTDPSVNSQYHHSGSQSMFLLSVNDTTLFCTPSAIPTVGNNIYVRYQAFMSYASYYSETKWIKGGVMTDTSDMSTFIALDSIGYHDFNNVFEEHEFTTADLDPTETYWVAWMFYSTNNGYGSYNRGAIDDVYINEIPSCQRVTSISVDTVTDESITLTWVDDAMSGVGYTVSCWADIEDFDTIVETCADTFYVFDNLEANTLYHFSVVVNCGSEDAEAVNATFRTACGATAIPYVEGFENFETSTVPLCWDNVNGTAYVRNGSAHGGSQRLDFRGSTSTIAVLPPFEAEVNTLQLRFWTRPEGSYSSCGTFSVGYITNPNEDSTFVELANYDYSEFIDGTAQYMEKTVMFAGVPDGVRMAFRHNANSSGYYWYVDDINVEVLPSCLPVTNLYVDTTVTSDGATIFWSAPEGQSNFVVRIDSTEYTVSGDTTFTFTGLEAMTMYTVSVASDCSDTISEWVSTTFTTKCASSTCEITVEMQDSFGDGWNGAQIEFFQNGAPAGIATLASGHNGTTTVSVCSGLPVTYNWHYGPYDSECSYTIYDGGNAEVYSSSDDVVSHSDTILEPCPSCMTPSGVMATAVDSTSITFAWDERDDVATYLVSFNGADYSAAYGGSETYGSLTPNTFYTFSVKVVCLPGDTSNARTITVRTACGQMALPFVEGFESNADGDVPSCWNLTTGTANVSASSYNAHTGNNYLTMNGGSTIATSQVPLDGDAIYVSFWAVNDGGTLEAGVMTNPLFDSTFIPLLNVPTNNDYELFEFNTSTLEHDSSYYVAFRFNAAYSYYSAYIDDINIHQDDGCMYPSDVTVDNVTENSATISWTNSGTATYFVVVYSTSAGSDTIDTYNTTVNLSSLTPSVSYDVRVGLVCGSDTLWTSTSFQTNCSLMSVPYSEDFDAYANDVMPPCWIWSSTYATHWDGGVFLKAYHGGGSEYVVVPELDGAISKLKIEFDTKVGTPAESDGILIGVTDAAGTLLAWLDTIQDPNFSRNNHVRKTVYFTNYTMPYGAARVAFAQYRNWNEWALIDNINIDVLPDCYPVDNLVGHNLDDPENTSFTWHPMGLENQWQVYVDTVTVGLDSIENIPATSFITVTDTTYTIPIGMIQGGGIYNFFVRANCGTEQSNWVKYEFGAGSIIMNNSSVADTVTGCGFVVYDNGGPIAGYLGNSNSALVLRSENVGSQLQIFGAKFGFGSSSATLTVYDGEGTTGTVLYTYNTVDGRDTILDSVLCVSTTGSLTVTFVVGGTMCHTGYELYVRCTEGAICPRPTELHAEMISPTQAQATWTGTAANYNFYYRIAGSPTWVMQPVATNNIILTGLTSDTVYDMYVVAVCSATDSSTASAIRQLNTVYTEPCDAPTDVTVSTITSNSAVISWTDHGESAWRISYNGIVIDVTTNPYTLTGLSAHTDYIVMVQALCDSSRTSTWSNSVSFTTAEPGVTNYMVTVNYDATMGTVTGAGPYASGSVVTLTATANSGYRFVQWSNGDTTESLSFLLTSDTTFTATFEAIPTYTVTVNYDTTMGTVTGAGEYEEGELVTLTATPFTGYHFVSWSNGDNAASISFTAASDTTFIASFAEDDTSVNYYTVTVVYDTAMGIVTGAGRYEEGAVVSLTATANSGYRFTGWSTGETNSTISLTVVSDTVINATFEAIPTYTVTVDYDTTMGVVRGAGVYTAGTTVSLTAIAYEGYRFVSWSTGETTASITLPALTGNVNLVATFEEIAAVCEAPTNLNYSNVTENTAVLNWTSDAAEWQLGLAKTSAPNDIRVVHVTTNPYTVSGLEANTSYDVKVRAICGAGDTSAWSTTVTFTTQQTQGIDDVEAGLISLYPNPASTTVTLTGIEGMATVTVVDMNGRVNGTWTVENGELTIDVTGFAQGAYFVRIVGEQSNAIRKLIVR